MPSCSLECSKGAPRCSEASCSLTTGTLFYPLHFYYTWTAKCLLHLLLHRRGVATTGNTAQSRPILGLVWASSRRFRCRTHVGTHTDVCTCRESTHCGAAAVHVADRRRQGTGAPAATQLNDHDISRSRTRTGCGTSTDADFYISAGLALLCSCIYMLAQDLESRRRARELDIDIKN